MVEGGEDVGGEVGREYKGGLEVSRGEVFAWFYAREKVTRTRRCSNKNLFSCCHAFRLVLIFESCESFSTECRKESVKNGE